MAHRITGDADAYEPVSEIDVAKRLREFAVHLTRQMFSTYSGAEIQDLADALEDIDPLIL